MAFVFAIQLFSCGALGVPGMLRQVVHADTNDSSSTMLPLIHLGGNVLAQIGTTPPTFSPTGTSVTHSVALTWNASTVTGSTIAGYWIYRTNTAGQETGTPVNTTIVTALTFTDLSVIAGGKYFYEVEAQAADGTQSGPSNEFAATIPTGTTISNPSGCNGKAQ